MNVSECGHFNVCDVCVDGLGGGGGGGMATRRECPSCGDVIDEDALRRQRSPQHRSSDSSTEVCCLHLIDHSFSIYIFSSPHRP